MSFLIYRRRAIVLTVWLCAIGSTVLACGQAAHPNMDSMKQKQLRYLALGDSYTVGESVAESERWPVQLANALSKAGISMSAPQIIATTGWTTSELSEGIAKADPQGPYDLVSLLIGVNNQYRGWSLEEYKEQFAGLLTQAIDFADGETLRVFVVSIPDWGVTPFAAGRNQEKIASEIDAFNAAARTIAEERGVAFVDITSGSRLAASDASLVAGDGLHPSGKMYAQWVEQIFPVVRPLLND